MLVLACLFLGCASVYTQRQPTPLLQCRHFSLNKYPIPFIPLLLLLQGEEVWYFLGIVCFWAVLASESLRVRAFEI
ncbi:hypothetical protein SLE2022_375040 [Rubroshorea leprosula]